MDWSGSGEKGVYLKSKTYKRHLLAERKYVIEGLAVQSQRTVMRKLDELLVRVVDQMASENPQKEKITDPLPEGIVKYNQQAKQLITDQLGQLNDHCDHHLHQVRHLDVEVLIHTRVITDLQIEEALLASSNAMKFVIESRQTVIRSTRGPARNAAPVKTLRDKVRPKLDELMELAKKTDSLCETYLLDREQELQAIQNSGQEKYDSRE